MEIPELILTALDANNGKISWDAYIELLPVREVPRAHAHIRALKAEGIAKRDVRRGENGMELSIVRIESEA